MNRRRVLALLLAEFFPDKRDALLATGREIGWLRVIGGAHYPEDVSASRVLGQALARAFLVDERFQHDVASTRGGFAAAGTP